MLIAVAALLGTVMAATAVGSSTDGRGSFTDDDGSIHESDINGLAASEITKGCNPPDNTRFCPHSPVTRAQMASFLVRALDLPAADQNPFTDTAGSVHLDDIDALAQADITKGCNPPDNTRYCPNDPVTRAQMASFLVRALDGVDAILNRLSLRSGLSCSKDGLSCSKRVTLAAGTRLEVEEGWYQVTPYRSGEEAAFKDGDTRLSVTWDGEPLAGDYLGVNESRSPATRMWEYRPPALTPGTHTLRMAWRWLGNSHQTASITITVP
ncbi:MAG TPA: S-layer homology domain-containing protein [Acidimicrobiia bacterium]|nr:S-layer homology domain-containing protein [Acidimicrobiia bacterium]